MYVELPVASALHLRRPNSSISNASHRYYQHLRKNLHYIVNFVASMFDSTPSPVQLFKFLSKLDLLPGVSYFVTFLKLNSSIRAHFCCSSPNKIAHGSSPDNPLASNFLAGRRQNLHVLYNL